MNTFAQIIWIILGFVAFCILTVAIFGDRHDYSQTAAAISFIVLLLAIITYAGLVDDDI
jgi:nitric oxide reductase large subunit